tara:strand:- start:208 stop:510 length:303 start_codon:yes stop_codon:yes gene_type:complete
MNNNNNNKEGQMAHKLQTRTFDFDGTTYKKGVDTYGFMDAVRIIFNSKKIQSSFIDKNGMLEFSDVSKSDAVDLLSAHSNRILVNKHGSALGCIIYLGAQ